MKIQHKLKIGSQRDLVGLIVSSQKEDLLAFLLEKLWKSREKQLEKVLLNAAHIRGSIEGIAGADAVNLNLTDDNEPLLLD